MKRVELSGVATRGGLMLSVQGTGTRDVGLLVWSCCYSVLPACTSYQSRIYPEGVRSDLLPTVGKDLL